MQTKNASIIVLTGGTSARFGSDKSKALIAGVSLIEHILLSIPQGLEIIVVGPDPGISGINYRVIRECPPGAGPVAGFKAAIETCTSATVVLLATDMPFALSHVLNLFSAMTPEDDAIMYVDSNNFRQPLAAIYRSEAVRTALEQMGDGQDHSMRTLVRHLRVREVAMRQEIAQALRDIDTPAELERAIAFARQLKDDSEL